MQTRFREGTFKHEDLFEILTVYMSVFTILFAGVNIGQMGQALKIKTKK